VGEPQDAAIVREGEILAGKYRVERVLGVGGMGVVVAAHHMQLDEKVAIKFLRPALLRDPELVGRFAREARAAVKIKSEHVARVLDVGTLESGAPYMVMEYLAGRDLAAWLQRHGRLPIGQAVDFVLQACVAVADAHRLGIVHRDLKPANLFCVRRSDGQLIIKLLDFGISKRTELGGAKQGALATKTGDLMGSPLYMSPEQTRSAKDVDAQTDIWALGVILYELLTGSRPFVGQSFQEIAIRIVTGSFLPLRKLRPEAPAGLEAVILRCLEKDARKRYENVADLAVALVHFGSKRSRGSIERTLGIIHSAGLLTISAALVRAPQVALATTLATQVSADDATVAQPAPSFAGLLSTIAAATRTAVVVRGRTKGAVTASVAVGLSVAVGVGWAVVHANHGPAVAPATSTPKGIMISAPDVRDPREPIEPSAATASPVPSDTGSTPSVSSPLPVRRELAPARPASGAGHISTAKEGGGAACNPPYTLDQNGEKHFKPECFASRSDLGF